MNLKIDLFLGLLVFYQLKQFVADFVLQNVWMLNKASPGWDFVPPLSIHCGVHAGLTLAAALYVNPDLWWLALLDFVIHFTMDRIKAGPRYLGRFHDIRSKAYWVTFGLDQMVHNLTHLWLAWYMAAH